jgi:hypothetical protein
MFVNSEPKDVYSRIFPKPTGRGVSWERNECIVVKKKNIALIVFRD